MKKIFLLPILLAYCQSCLAQPSDSCVVLNNNPYTDLKNIAILPDQNYTFERVLQDSSLPFSRERHVLSAKTSDYYWVRCTVQNPSKYSKRYYISAFPFLDNTLYYYDDDAQKWLTTQNGLNIGNTAMRNAGFLPCVFQANQKTTFFIKMSVQRLKEQPFGSSVKISLSVLDAATCDTTDAQHYWYWLIASTIITMFFCYNAYIYFLYKDDTHFYYLAILLGGMFYSTGLHKIPNILWQIRLYSIDVSENGNMYHYNFSSLISAIGALFVVVGFVQLTRSYFQLKTRQPKLDTILKYAIPIFSVLRLANAVSTISGIYYMDNKYNFIENNFIIGIFLLLLYGSMTAYRRGFKPAKYFLIAHAIPLLLIMVIAVLVSFYYENQLGVFILPDIVAAIQSVTCTLALVARVDFAQAELAEQRGIAADLQRENERISLQSQIIAAQNERVKAEHALTQAEQESLENKLAFNQRELASATMYLYQKNEILLDLQKQIARLPQIATHATSVKLINNAIQSNIYLEADWENFKRHFEQVHPDFFKKLQAEHPALTANETRLCAYFHINLSVKEIAAMQNIDPASVRKARMRLNKKMNMEADKAEID